MKSRASLLMCAVLLLVGAQAALGQDVLLGTITNSTAGQEEDLNPVTITGASVTLAFNVSSGLGAPCVGCALNLGIGSFASATYTFDASNTPGFSQFATMVTSPADLSDILVQGNAIWVNGTAMCCSGGGSPMSLWFVNPQWSGPPLTGDTVNDIQANVSDYSFSVTHANGYTIDTLSVGQVIWKFFGTVGSGSAVAAPEIDPAAATGAFTLLLGALAVLSGRRPSGS